MKNLWFKSKSPEERSPFWWLRWVADRRPVSALVIYFLYIVGSVAIVPVLASFALAYLLNPIVYQAEQRGLSRTMSAIIAILLVTLIIAAFMAYVVPDLWAESTESRFQNCRKIHAGKRRATENVSPALFASAGTSGRR
jgi:predicted PurR-regulated permease PerM